jgi:hypothetical protein
MHVLPSLYKESLSHDRLDLSSGLYDKPCTTFSDKGDSEIMDFVPFLLDIEYFVPIVVSSMA